MGSLIYSKICIVLTVGLAGLNVHQLLSSYSYVKEKIDELNGLIHEESDMKSLNFVSVVFYFVIPALYMFALSLADFFLFGLIIVSLKFAISAVLGIWTQKRVFTDFGYTRKIHLIGKVDNFLNLISASGVAFLLIFPWKA